MGYLSAFFLALLIEDMEHQTAGDSLFLQDRFSEAADHYRLVTPLSADAAAHLSLCLLNLGEASEALALLDQFQGDSPALQLARAKVLFHDQQFAAAQALFEQVHTLPQAARDKWVGKCRMAQGL